MIKITLIGSMWQQLNDLIDVKSTYWQHFFLSIFFSFFQSKFLRFTCCSMPFWLDSSPPCCMCSIKPSTRTNLNGNLRMVLSELTQDLVSAQCPQSRMLKVHSCGSKLPTKRTQTTGLVLWMNSFSVSLLTN